MVRLGPVWAVAMRDLRRVRGGRGRWSMLGLALALVVPLAAAPCEGVDLLPQRTAARPRVSGTPPESVKAVADVIAAGPIRVDEGPPAVVSTGSRRVPVWLRHALESRDVGPQVTLERRAAPMWIPGRNLWVLLLAASLLTGPLVESIPGERAQSTWETLRAAAVTSGEVVAGKWVAWTLAAVLVAAVGVLSGLVSGTQTLGWSLLGVPLVLGSVVALGLWLVHDVDDPAGAATIPVRVIPLVLVGAVLASWGLAESWPMLASMVPFGAPLLLAAGLPGSEGWLIAALVSSTLTCIAFLSMTAVGVQRGPTETNRRWVEQLVPALVGAWVWWAAVVGPQLWELAGSSLQPGSALPTAAGGVGLAVVAGALYLRGSAGSGRLSPAWGVGLLAGLTLAGIDRWVPDLSHGGPLFEALSGQTTPMLGAALVGALGQELFFRGALSQRVSPAWVALLWALTTRPMDPAAGIAGGLLLWWCHRRGGLWTCVAAHLVWVTALAAMDWI